MAPARQYVAAEVFANQDRACRFVGHGPDLVREAPDSSGDAVTRSGSRRRLRILRDTVGDLIPRCLEGHELMRARRHVGVGVQGAEWHDGPAPAHRTPRHETAAVAAETRAEELRAGQI